MTEVSHTDQLSLVNKMFIIWQTRKISFVQCKWFLLANILLANGNEMKLKFAKVCSSSLPFLSKSLSLVFVVETN